MSKEFKNSEWEILSQNLVTFKRQDGIKDEKLKHFGGSLKNMTFREGERGSRKTNIEGGLPKKGVLEQFADLRRGLGKKKGGGVFERGG